LRAFGPFGCHAHEPSDIEVAAAHRARAAIETSDVARFACPSRQETGYAGAEQSAEGDRSHGCCTIGAGNDRCLIVNNR